MGRGFNDENPYKGLRSVPVIVERGGEEYLGRRGVPGVGGTSIDEKPLERAEKCP